MDQAVKDRAKAQFGATAEKYVESRSHKAGDDLPRMVELAEPTPNDRLLDIATGGGNVARVLAPLVGEVVASDLTPRMLEAVESAFTPLGLTNVSYAEADAEALPFPDASFDIVTCRIAPHHFPNPDRFVQESFRVLRPGGRFLLVDTVVPDGEDGDFWNRFEAVRDPSHARSLTEAEWSSLISAAGFDLRLYEPYPKQHPFADWVGRADVPGATLPALVEMLRNASDSVAETYRIEWDGERVVSFTDVKGLFFAIRPS